MADDFVRVPLDSTGKRVDCSKLNIGGNDVERQRAVLGDDTDPAGLAKILLAQPVGTEYGLVVRPIPGAPQGITFDTTHANPLLEAPITFNAAGDNPVINGVNGKVIKIWKLWLQIGGICSVTFKDGGNALSGPCPMEQGGGLVLPRDSDPWFTCTANNAFQLNLDQPAQVSGRAYYTQG